MPAYILQFEVDECGMVPELPLTKHILIMLYNGKKKATTGLKKPHL